MTKIDIDTQVDAPVEELFDLMADPATEEHWNPDAREVHRVGDGPLAAGARWQGVYRGMGAMDITLTDYDRPHRLGFDITGSRMDMHWTFEFTPAGDGTRLRAAAELIPKGALRLMSPLFGPMMRRTFAARPAQLEAGVRKMRAGG